MEEERREGGMRDLRSGSPGMERETMKGGLLKRASSSELEGPPVEVKQFPDDNWKHRSSMMLCGTCMAFVPKITKKVQRDDHRIGRCRYGAPTMDGFPVVFSDDWCRRHKIDEEKI